MKHRGEWGPPLAGPSSAVMMPGGYCVSYGGPLLAPAVRRGAKSRPMHDNPAAPC